MFIRVTDQDDNPIVLSAGGILAVYGDQDPNRCRLRHASRSAAFVVKASVADVEALLVRVSGKPIETP